MREFITRIIILRALLWAEYLGLGLQHMNPGEIKVAVFRDRASKEVLLAL